MATTESTQASRFEARIAPEVLAVVRRAAEVQGRSVSDFIVAAAQEAEHRTIAESGVIKLSLASQQAFAEMLINPPEPTESLRKSIARHKALVRESR